MIDNSTDCITSDSPRNNAIESMSQNRRVDAYKSYDDSHSVYTWQRECKRLN